MTLYTDPRLTALGIVHGTTHKALGDMRQAGCVAQLWDTYQIPPQQVLRFTQIHSDKIIPLTDEQKVQTLLGSPLQEADGWVLSVAGYAAAILTADCVPLFVWDPEARVLGLSHCGWRGVAAGLPAKTVRSLRKAGAQGPLAAWVGPHIQSCCFEVQSDVAAHFAQATLVRNGHTFVDLNQAIEKQLLQEGLQAKDLVFSAHCTCCEKENFFSFRRQHSREALLSFVYIPPTKLQ